VRTYKQIRDDYFAKAINFGEFLDQMDEWKAQGEWIPACGGTETPCHYRSGAKLLYCYQPRSGRHAYLDCNTDIILSDEEASQLIG